VAVLLSLFVFAVVVLLSGAVYQRIALARDGRRFPAPGRMVKVGGVRLHVNVMGEGSPVVVFEAGIAATSLSWRPVQLEISKLTTTASYDRAGLGWSDAASSPRGIGQVAEELHALLDCAGLAGPWILVAHSYGGLVARAYVQRYPAEVAGMVLADPVAAREWAEPSESNRKLLRRGIRLSWRGALLARFGVVRLALSLLSAGARRAPKLMARATSGPAVAFVERILGEIRKLPPEIWPLIQAHWSDPKCFEAMAGYLEALPESAAAVAGETTARGSLQDLPLVVLSAEDADSIQRAEHEMLAQLSVHRRVETVPASGHWIQLDRPDELIRAIREIVLGLRRSA
jgi:pimeloyl-ACP methyl ester carboxylesterase